MLVVCACSSVVMRDDVTLVVLGDILSDNRNALLGSVVLVVIVYLVVMVIVRMERGARTDGCVCISSGLCMCAADCKIGLLCFTRSLALAL